jgi:iron complex outermembrane recepter protein
MTYNNSRTSACDARIYSIVRPDGIGRSGQTLQWYSAALFLCIASPAFAADDLDKDKTAGATLQEVVVTAEHRETNLQDTPIAVSALTGDMIQQDRIINLRDVAARVPSITFDQASSAETFISIRGTTIGNDAAGIDQGVSVFIDDVPTTGFGDDSPDLYDLQSIEVLRGPQGTLFGRNVTGGAVLIHTRKPSFTASSEGTLTYGSNNLMEAQMYLTGPIVGDTLAGKISYDLRRRDNFLPNTALHNLTNGENVGSVRGQLLWVQSDDFNLTLGADYLDDTSQDKIQYLMGNFQPSLLPPLTYGPHATNEGIDNSVDKKAGGGLIKAEWTLPSATLTSISGYRNVKDVTHFSTSGDPDNSVISDPVVQDDQFSEEVRLISAAGQKLTWTTGLFLLHGHRAYLQTINFDALPGSLLQTCCLRFIGPFVNHQNQHVTVESEAIYGEGTYAFTDELKLTLGGRFSHEKKSGHTEVFETSSVNPNLSTGEYSKAWNSFTPKIMLSYQPTHEFLAYVSATNGYESGGYDTNGTDKASLASAYNPEKVWSYEAGIKTEWFQRRVVFNASIYDAEYSDLQTRNFDPNTGTAVAGNAAKARVQGFESETQWIVIQGLNLGLTYSYTKGRYRSYNTSDGDFSGNTIPNTPTHMLNANVDYRFDNPLGAGLFGLGADVTYRSKIQFDDANDTVQYVVDKSSYRGLVNLHGMWESSDDKIEVSVWAKNLTNMQSVINTANLGKFVLTAAEINAGNSLYITTWTPSRTVGVSLTAKF